MGNPGRELIFTFLHMHKISYLSISWFSVLIVLFPSLISAQSSDVLSLEVKNDICQVIVDGTDLDVWQSVELERSFGDTTLFKFLYKWDAAKLVEGQEKLSVVDRLPKMFNAPNVYYRCKITYGQKVWYSNTREVILQQKRNDLFLTAHASEKDGSLVVQFHVPGASDLNITVTEATGLVLFEKKIEDHKEPEQFTVDTNNWVPGTYYISLFGGGQHRVLKYQR